MCDSVHTSLPSPQLDPIIEGEHSITGHVVHAEDPVLCSSNPARQGVRHRSQKSPGLLDLDHIALIRIPQHGRARHVLEGGQFPHVTVSGGVGECGHLHQGRLQPDLPDAPSP